MGVSRHRRTGITCVDCGCGVAHGDAERSDPHLVAEDIKKMAEADGTSMSTVLANINAAADRDRLDHADEWA
jgi:hypothetical protein